MLFSVSIVILSKINDDYDTTRGNNNDDVNQPATVTETYCASLALLVAGT